MKNKITLLTVLITFWASVGFASDPDPVMELRELHGRLTAEREAFRTTQTDDKFDFVKDSSLQDALTMLPKRSPYQEVSDVLVQIPETELAFRKRTNQRGPLATGSINDVRAEMSSISLARLFNRRDLLLTYFTMDDDTAEPALFDEAAFIKGLYGETMDDDKASQLCLHFLTRKQQGEDLTGEIREFIEAQKVQSPQDIFYDLRFKVMCVAHGMGYSIDLGNNTRLSNTVKVIGDVYGSRDAVDPTFNALGYGDTWPVWEREFGIKHGGDRGGQVYDRVRGITPSWDKAAEVEVRRWFARR